MAISYDLTWHQTVKKFAEFLSSGQPSCFTAEEMEAADFTSDYGPWFVQKKFARLIKTRDLGVPVKVTVEPSEHYLEAARSAKLPTGEIMDCVVIRFSFDSDEDAVWFKLRWL